MNVVIQKGNVTRDIELKPVNDTVVANFSMAINRQYKKQDGSKAEETTFVDYEAWGSGAETLQKYVKKGDPLLIEGAMKQQTWETDGQKRSKHVVRVNKFEFLSRGGGTTASTPQAETEDNAVKMDADIPF